MAISKQKKGEILNDLKEIIKNSGSIVFVNFHGLSVSDVTALRKDLKESGVSYKVVKKTLVKKAFEGASAKGEMPPLEGELSLVYGEDSIKPAKEIYSHGKKLEGKLSILGGIFEGGYMDKESMVNVAQIPSREVLYAQFVNLINSPIRGLVVSLDQIAKSR